MLSKLKFLVTESIQQWLRHRGREVVRWPLAEHLVKNGISMVIDVGASTGGYAAGLRSTGYRGRIVSFEPRQEAFRILSRSSEQDALWEAERLGIGEHPGSATIQISSNGDSSSLMPMLEKHLSAAPSVQTIGTEEVIIQTLDEVFERLCKKEQHVALKIDTQGYEMSVLRSGKSCLSRVKLLQIELSLVQLYEGQPVIEEVIAYLRTQGFTPIWLMHGFSDPVKRQLLQVDGLFINSL
ncbi:MAG: hypothetical protein JWO08_2437 [Verrucomicrobiaceae bacterium]|nr:hypothetical protein [Verrucomicrobiaceae bacterium]